VQLNKYLPNAFSVLVGVQLCRNNDTKAITAFRKSVTLDSSGKDGLTLLSMSLSATDHGESALHYIKIAIQLT